jgi:NAD(P)-dependent dehydrogenase (short-subunit alcohol dehydrogenase family)
MLVDIMNLNSAISLVTGAGGGMGESIARELAACGGLVIIADIEKEAADRVAQDILSHDGQAVAIQVDVANAHAMQAVAGEIFSRHGRLDVLVNNAGVSMRPPRAVWDASITDFEWMMRVNYFGVVNGILSFLPRMRSQGTRGHIVNTSSCITLDEMPGYGMYTASKAAVDGISQVLRAELEDQGDRIGVTVLQPGLVTTRLGTSERLRDASDRSEAREVRPYERVRPVAAYEAAIEPGLVGPMVIEAIEQNSPYCLTHPAPLESLARRLRDYERAAHDVRSA